MTENKSIKSAVSSDDVEEMAKILRKKYGENAVEVVDLLMHDHVTSHDTKRASAWAAVSRYLCQDEGFSVSLQ